MTRPALRSWQRVTGQRPFVLGHRGVRGPGVRVTENTLAALEAAIEAGADGVELDVRLTRDGAVVVFHDATLTRITRGAHTARVDELSAAELRALTLPCGRQIPLLDEALDWSRRHQCKVNIELKYDGGDPAPLVTAVASCVRSAASPERLLLSSFDGATVLLLAHELEDHVIACLTEYPLAVPAVDELTEHGVIAIHPEHSLLSPAALAAFRRCFALVNTWTVNDAHRVNELARLGVDTIITDDPTGALAALAAPA